MPGLAKADIRTFNYEGYVLVKRPVFQAPAFQKLLAYFETFATASVAQGRRLESLDRPHMTLPALFEWLFDDDVLDIVESIVGPDIALWSSHFICKPPGIGQRVGWHEDSSYWNSASGPIIDPMDVVTLWLAIDPSMVTNGCMRVIPGTHHHGYSQYVDCSDRELAVFGNEISRCQYDESKAVDCVLDANQCSLHHAKLIHGSNANTSPQRRCGFTMRYFSTECTFRPELMPDGHEVFLARGRDRAGNVYGDPAKPGKHWQGQRFSVSV